MKSSKKIRKKTTIVREHPLHVPVSEKNPTGVTIRNQRDYFNKKFGTNPPLYLTVRLRVYSCASSCSQADIYQKNHH